MKKILLCSLVLTLLMVAVPGNAQPSLGLTNLNGFPSVVTSGTQYNLSGWIVNSGSTAFSGNVDVRMELNAQNILPIANNFAISTPLQPGDSVYWTESNHTFPSGQFRLGNNDVLIWPTAPSTSGEVHSDTLYMPMYYTEGAAFRLNPLAFTTLGSVAMDQDYTFSCHATNEGGAPNIENVRLYARIAGFGPEMVAETMGSFYPGQEVEFSVQAFNVARIFDVDAQSMSARVTQVEFWALEQDASYEPLNSVALDISEAVGIQNPAVASLGVYPNPCTDILKLVVPSDWLSGTVTITDLTGRELLRQSLMGLEVNVADLPAGVYSLAVRTELGSLQKSFIHR